MSTYGIDDLVYEWDATGAFSGAQVNITARLDMNSPINAKTKAILDEYRVAGGVWMKREASGQKDWDGKFVLEFVYDPGGSPDLDDIFYDEGNKLGATGSLRITWGGTKKTTQPCVIEDYERLPATEKQHRSKVTLAQNGAPTEV